MPLRNETSDRISCSWSTDRALHYDPKGGILPTVLDEDPKTSFRRPFVSYSTFFSPNA
ncbi:MAG: hypothetical protein Q8Q12_04865 [bacterium]|nr:hypothetical protein [bacterium]